MQVLQYEGPASSKPGQLLRVLLTLAPEGLPWGLLWHKDTLVITSHSGQDQRAKPCILVYHLPGDVSCTTAVPVLQHRVSDARLQHPNMIAWDAEEHARNNTDALEEAHFSPWAGCYAHWPHYKEARYLMDGYNGFDWAPSDY